MKSLVSFWLCAAALCSSAATFDVDGTFSAQVGREGLPQTWTFHKWSGYMPYPQATCVEGDRPGSRAFALRDVRGKFGAGVLSTVRRAAACGDRITVSLAARGSGTAWVTLARLTEGGKWNGAQPRVSIDLAPEWKTYDCVFVLQDGAQGPTRTIQVEVGLDKGAEGMFTDIVADHDPADGTAGAGAKREWRYVMEKGTVYARDDFEDASRVRTGPVRRVGDIVAPGLLSKTMMGRYASATSCVVTVGRAPVPARDDVYAAANMRLYGFRATAPATSVLRLASRERAYELAVEDDPLCRDLFCTVSSPGAQNGRFRVPRAVLPADFTFGVARDGRLIFAVTSLSDASVRVRRAVALPPVADAPLVASWSFDPRGTPATVRVDELAVHEIRYLLKDMTPPLVLTAPETFDPVRERWPLVFADEFDAPALDWNKWFVPWYVKPDKARHFSLNGKGCLSLKVEKDEKTGKLETGSIWTKQAWRYGYFEARLRFTRNPGWWSAFWLYGVSNRNAFWDGFEIDIQEDYYTRPKEKGGAPRKTLDHNVHVYMGELLKSWNYNSELPGTLDDFYTLGCRWTPFEIAYYLNGRRIASKASHAPHGNVTFDAFNHVYGLVPLHAIVSGQIMGPKWFASDISGATFPEEYLVDYVRVYGYPGEPGDDPTVTVKDSADRALFVQEGTRLTFAAQAREAANGAAPIRAAYLFDNGFLIAFKKEPPYVFEVPFTAPYYETTRWMKSGRSGQKPAFDGRPHVFVVAVQDANGRVGHSEKIVKIRRDATRFEPYENTPARLPLFVPAWRYDAGGQGVAYYDTTPENKYWGRKVRPDEAVDAGKEGVYYVETGEWLNYTVDVAQAGAYAIALRGSCRKVIPGVRRMPLYVDGKPCGTYTYGPGDPEKGTVIETVLSPGLHTFTLFLNGPFDFNGLDFKRKE